LATATARLEIRLPEEQRAEIERAAEVLELPVSEWVRNTLERAAAEVLRATMHETRVSPEFFQELLDALDRPPVPNEPMRRAFQRARDVVVAE
jgi:uncharacterized protein (DUF1778 family)